MANRSKAELARRIAGTAWAPQFRKLYGDDILDNPDRAFDKLTQAIARFEKEDTAFNAFTSKYDAVLRGEAKLTPQEERGRILFDDPKKGNCAACHPSARADGAPPLFTDFTYDNLGVPRNAEIPANADPAYFDLGLCGPDRSDLDKRRDLCGAFKVPTLRNVATRQVFFHNGLFKTLRDAVRFYVRRDTNPDEFYPRDADGKVLKFDDLPPELHRNVNIEEVPYDRHPGQAPRLNETEIDDLLAFLATLTDGYDAATDTADPARNLTH